MWHHHQVCAGPNSPLPDVNGSIQSYLALGAPSDKLILGIPFYGYEYRCNDSFSMPSSFAPCATSTCVVGDLQHYNNEHYGTGAWSIERFQHNSSTGCVKHWSEEWSSPYLDCPASSYGPFPGFGSRGGASPFRARSRSRCHPLSIPPFFHSADNHVCAGAPAHAARSQTWYDDAHSTKLKVGLACMLGLGGVGAFTAENIGGGSDAIDYWEALKTFTEC